MSGSFLESPPRVLVVEDDEKLAALLCRALRDEGLAAESTFDGSSALRRLSEVPFSAALLDVGLPGVNGLDVCVHIRRSGCTIPVIMLSARDSVDDVEAGRRAGATDYLLKPVSLRDLTTRLEVLIAADSSPHRQLIAAA